MRREDRPLAQAVELLSDALAICKDLLDSEPDEGTAQTLREAVKEIELAIGILERHERPAIPLRH